MAVDLLPRWVRDGTFSRTFLHVSQRRTSKLGLRLLWDRSRPHMLQLLVIHHPRQWCDWAHGGESSSTPGRSARTAQGPNALRGQQGPNALREQSDAPLLPRPSVRFWAAADAAGCLFGCSRPLSQGKASTAQSSLRTGTADAPAGGRIIRQVLRLAVAAVTRIACSRSGLAQSNRPLGPARHIWLADLLQRGKNPRCTV